MNQRSHNQPEVDRFLRHILDIAGFSLEFTIETRQGPPLQWIIRFTGPDVPMLIANESKLLNALGHLTAESFGFGGTHADLSTLTLDGSRPPALQFSN